MTKGINGTHIDALRDLQEVIRAANAAKGFHDTGDALRARASESPLQDMAQENLRNHRVARIALIMGEGTEAIEELRSGRAIDETYYVEGEKYATARGDASHGAARVFTQNKPEGVPSELADIAIRTFDLAGEEGIDLPAVIADKLRYNETRPHLHGRTM